MRVEMEPSSDDFQLPADDLHENFIVTVPSDRGTGSIHLTSHSFGAVRWQCLKAACVLFVPLHSLEKQTLSSYHFQCWFNRQRTLWYVHRCPFFSQIFDGALCRAFKVQRKCVSPLQITHLPPVWDLLLPLA